MKTLSKYVQLITTVISVFMLFIVASPVSATTYDETVLTSVANQVDDLWTFVDSSAQTPDDQFYPVFAKRADTAHQKVAVAYDTLGKTTETRQAKQAIENIRIDLKAMLKQIDAWKLAANNADATAFQTASDNLSTTVSTYNADVASYNVAAYGSHATLLVVLYAGSFVAAFSICAFLFAFAVYKNAKSQDTAREILRRLRWHAAFASLLILIGTAMPAYLFLFTDATPMWWTWVLAVIGLGLICLVLYRALKVRNLIKTASLQ